MRREKVRSSGKRSGARGLGHSVALSSNNVRLMSLCIAKSESDSYSSDRIITQVKGISITGEMFGLDRIVFGCES